MRYTTLGARSPRVSTVGFGAWAIGGSNWGATDDDVSRRAVRVALDEGVNFIDTADVYGFGHSEELIGQVLRERGKGETVLATKAGSDFYNGTPADDQGYGPIRPNYSKSYLMFAAEQSLKRLGVEVLDILQLHSPDLSLLEQDEPWDALRNLKQTGKIRYAGLSVQSFKETEQAHLLDRHHGLLDCIQVRYNLLEREAERVLLPKAAQYGLGVIVRIPLLFGLLTGKFDQSSRFSKDDHRSMNLSPPKLEKYLSQLAQLKPLRQQLADQTPAQIALRFCLSHPSCHTVIPGAKTPQQVLENCAASDLGGLTARELELLPPIDDT